MFALLLQGAPPIPASAYLLCFIPLATIIIGLITLFVLTDRHASRPYARYNPFVAAGASAGELEARPPVVGETPAGSGAQSHAPTMTESGVIVGTTAYTDDGDVIEHSSSYYRADRYEYSTTQTCCE